MNAFSIRAGIRLQDLLTIFKVLTAVVISIMGVVVLSNKSIIAGGNSLEGDPFKGLGSISYGQFALAFYSGTEKKIKEKRKTMSQRVFFHKDCGLMMAGTT